MVAKIFFHGSLKFNEELGMSNEELGMSNEELGLT